MRMMSSSSLGDWQNIKSKCRRRQKLAFGRVCRPLNGSTRITRKTGLLETTPRSVQSNNRSAAAEFGFDAPTNNDGSVLVTRSTSAPRLFPTVCFTITILEEEELSHAAVIPSPLSNNHIYNNDHRSKPWDRGYSRRHVSSTGNSLVAW